MDERRARILDDAVGDATVRERYLSKVHHAAGLRLGLGKGRPEECARHRRGGASDKRAAQKRPARQHRPLHALHYAMIAHAEHPP